MKLTRYSHQSGAINGQLVIIISLLVVIVGLSGLSAWLYGQYTEQKSDVEGKIAVAEAEARKDQSEIEEEKYAEREKEPNREFAAPEDFGRLSFAYPKTWSVYVADDGSGRSSQFTAFLNPITVPPVNSQTARFALRVSIENKQYDQVLESYRRSIEQGELTSKPISVNGHDGTRLDGSLARDIRGSAVLFKVRDKTITVFSEVDTFKADFEKIIKTIDFND